MKLLAWLAAAVNLYFGARCFLNAIHVLHTSKYSQGATVTFAILFLALGAGGLYLSIAKQSQGLALLAGFGPWVLALVVMFFVLITGKYQ
jgi:hypothetical protein